MLAEEAAAAATEVPETEVESEAPAAAEEAEAKPAKSQEGAQGEEARHSEEAGHPPAVRRGEQVSPGFDFFFFFCSMLGDLI